VKATALLQLNSTAAAELTAQVSALQQSTDTANSAYSSTLSARIGELAAAMQAQLARVRRLSSYSTTIRSSTALDSNADSSSASTEDKAAENSVTVMETAVDTLVTCLRTGLNKLSLIAAKMTAAATEHSLLEYSIDTAKHSSSNSSSSSGSSSAPQTCAGCKQRFRANHELKRALDVTLMSASSSRLSVGAFDYT
jgi:hypothetical protein